MRNHLNPHHCLIALTTVVGGITGVAAADLAVSNDLGALGNGARTLSGTTLNAANNADGYTSVNTSNIWDGEYVYQFTLSKPAFLWVTDTLKFDADNNGFADHNHDYFLLNTLTTFQTTNGLGNPYTRGTSLSFKDEYRSGVPDYEAFTSSTNAKGLYPAGTYYLSVDNRRGSVAIPTPKPGGTYSVKLHSLYQGEGVAPTATTTELKTGGQITGSYKTGDVLYFGFDYAGGAGFSIDTRGGGLAGANDTFIALYNAFGEYMYGNDEDTVSDGQAASEIIVPANTLAAGTYYLALSSGDGVASPNFSVSLDPTFTNRDGAFVINGLSVVPEPSAMVTLGIAAAAMLRRRRQA